MPRIAKDEELNKLNNKVTSKAKVTKKTSTTKKTEALKAFSKSKLAKASNESKENKEGTKTVKKANTVKTDKVTKTNKTAKSATTKVSKNVKKNVETSKSTSRKKSTQKKEVLKKSNSKKTVKKVTLPLEYYDLPSAYNETIVKVLAQTPSCLFVYWEVSEKDSKNLLKKYGDNFFESTKPYLLIINESMNYSFEVEINDYANSWYIHINDSDCKYVVKLIRKPINNSISNISYSVDISSSNKMDAPNDHILFDKLGKTVFFKNVKTNVITPKNISTLSFISNIGRIYNIYDLYKQIYKNELYEDELGFGLSSSQFSSTFK